MQLFIDIGGIIGLLAGLSILGLLEIVELCMDYMTLLIYVCTKKPYWGEPRKRKTSSIEEDEKFELDDFTAITRWCSRDEYIMDTAVNASVPSSAVSAEIESNTVIPSSDRAVSMDISNNAVFCHVVPVTKQGQMQENLAENMVSLPNVPAQSKSRKVTKDVLKKKNSKKVEPVKKMWRY